MSDPDAALRFGAAAGRRRSEDGPLLIGGRRFTDDVDLAGQGHLSTFGPRPCALGTPSVASRSQMNGGQGGGAGLRRRDRQWAARGGASLRSGHRRCGVHLGTLHRGGVDPETGALAVVGYAAVDDVERIVHEPIPEGQIHGGVAQGLGQMLGEQVVYDESGQLLTASFMDHMLPRADDLPTLRVGHHRVPCATNPLGLKESGGRARCPRR